MAGSRRSNPKNPSAKNIAPDAPASGPVYGLGLDTGPPEGAEYTGRYLVLMRDEAPKEGLKAIRNSTGLTEVCSTADFAAAAVEMGQADRAEVFLLDQLRVAVVDVDPRQARGLRSMAAADDSAILAVEPEQMCYAFADSAEYLRGYRDAVNHLYAQLVGEPPRELDEAEAAAFGLFADTDLLSWGLQATKASKSRFTGKGVRVAVLDTGFDLAHPEFAGRAVTSQSFVAGQQVADGNGHGTHCIGTSLGSRQFSERGRGYGCAPDAEIFVGKVLSNQGSGGDSGILAGINWAVTNKCRVISMSLGAAVAPGESFSQIYETVAQRALQASPGTLIVAATGNDSRNRATLRRLEPPKPVGRPANCPSIMGVAAVDPRMAIAAFSNGGVSKTGGGVDIAGPGVDVYSSWPDPSPSTSTPARHHTISGTSMATPHVAGIAALWLEAKGANTSAQALWQLLTGNAKRLSLSSRDVGVGLVQAPT